MTSLGFRYSIGLPLVLGMLFAGCSATDSQGLNSSGQLLVAPETIDFESATPGTILDSVNGDGGTGPIFVKGLNPQCTGLDPWNAAVVFDSSNPPPGDLDLGTPNETFGGPGVGIGGEMGMPNENGNAEGHILIVNECRFFVDRNEDDKIDTDDSPVELTDDVDAVGSSIEFDFSAVGPVSILSILIIDVEAGEPAATVEMFDGSDGLISMETLPQVSNNGVGVVDLGMVSGVVRMVVTLNGSGAIDSIVFEPAAAPFCGDGNLDEGEECDDGNNDPGDGCDPFCDVERGDEGCTPGYYKQAHHLCAWAYEPDDLFDDVFMVDASGDDSLLEALSDGGGGETAFQRHAVAALLNAANGGVYYAYSVDEVRATVQKAYMTGNFEELKDQLEDANTAGCTLGNCR
jgi:cysteine-rich repeat protein